MRASQFLRASQAGRARSRRAGLRRNPATTGFRALKSLRWDDRQLAPLAIIGPAAPPSTRTWTSRVSLGTPSGAAWSPRRPRRPSKSARLWPRRGTRPWPWSGATSARGACSGTTRPRRWPFEAGGSAWTLNAFQAVAYRLMRRAVLVSRLRVQRAGSKHQLEHWIASC